jgi:exodeoxyribonuclease V beta subunit
LFPAEDLNAWSRRIVVRSFSSLRREAEAAAPQFGDRIAHQDEEAGAVLAGDDVLRGVVFGDLVHNVLEQIDFAAIGRAGSAADLLQPGPARRLLDSEVRRAVPKFATRAPAERIEQACLRQVAELTWHALHTPLGAAGGPLWQIPQADRLHELEFLFPRGKDAAEESFVTGFMDLVFRAQDKYFLLDWKTNLLPAYQPANLARCMAESEYHQQYRLYLQALARWLKRSLGDCFNLERHLGGVYYLFVRGMNGRDESTGVVFHRPSEAA